MSNAPNLRPHRAFLLYVSSLKNREGGNAVNDCKKPSLGASKADLLEFHKEALRSRRHRQLARQPNSVVGFPSKNDNPAYRKSIWPASKIARKAQGQ